MRLTYLGNFSVPFSTENHYAATLEAMGHQVIRLQEAQATSEQILDWALNSQAFVWSKTHGWETPGNMSMSDVLLNLKNNGIPTMAYHLDLYFPIPERWAQYQNSEYFQIGHFFTCDKPMADWLNENTEVKGHYLPAGVFEPECYRLEPNQEPLNDVIFVGSRGYHPTWPWRPQLIDWLRETYGDRFKHYGGDGIRIVRGHELNQLYANSKVVVGDSYVHNFDYPDYWSDRVYETLGRGGFLLMPKIKGLEIEFNEDELPTFEFGNFGDLKTKIDFYIENDAYREAMRQKGFNKVINNYSYTHRWQTILKELGL